MFDCRGLRPTDIKSNSRIQLTAPRSAREEAELNTRKTLMLREAYKYLQQKVEADNLTPAEARGLKKISKRVENGELIVATTDKSGKLCVISNEIWQEMGEVHLAGDQKVTWDEVLAAQSRIKGHLRILNNIMNPGADGETR